MLPYKVISGGQTGVDQAALAVAYLKGILTGGWMPRGFRTNTGPRPDLATLYGMSEHVSAEYAPRTKENVNDADAVIILGFGDSPGCKLTKRLCLDLGKPVIYEPWEGGMARTYDAAQRLILWLKKYDPAVLMVAGNREETKPGVGKWSTDVLMEMWRT